MHDKDCWLEIYVNSKLSTCSNKLKNIIKLKFFRNLSYAKLEHDN